MKQVTIFGLGLIGASLGLALKQLKPAPVVIGNDVQYDAARRASGMKAVDRVERDPARAVEGSDLVVVATPVGAIPEVFKEIAGSLEEGCVVTDTGSTKREIIRQADETLPAHVAFVGGHPMTGKATAGVDGPAAILFLNAVYCLTPTSSTPTRAVQEVASVVQQVGAQPYFLDPAEHDGLVAGISHVPYLLSATLMRVMASERSWREMSPLAAGGFDTATRLAADDPKMFADILATNGDNVARHLDRFTEELKALSQRLLARDPTIIKELEEAQTKRLAWEIQRRQARGEEVPQEKGKEKEKDRGFPRRRWPI